MNLGPDGSTFSTMDAGDWISLGAIAISAGIAIWATAVARGAKSAAVDSAEASHRSADAAERSAAAEERAVALAEEHADAQRAIAESRRVTWGFDQLQSLRGELRHEGTRTAYDVEVTTPSGSTTEYAEFEPGDAVAIRLDWRLAIQSGVLNVRWRDAPGDFNDPRRTKAFPVSR